MKSIRDFIGLMWRYAPRQTVFIFLLSVLNGFSPFVAVIFATELINLAIGSVASGVIHPRIYLDIVIILLSSGYELMFYTLQRFVSERAKIRVRCGFRGRLLEKCARLNYAYLEDAKACNLISRVLDKPEDTLVSNYTALCQLLGSLISVVSVVSLVASQVWWAAVVIVLCCAPLFTLSVKSGRANYTAKRNASELDRKCDYLSQVLSNRENVDERTLFGFTQRFNKVYHGEYNASFGIKTATRLHWFFKTKLGGVFTALSALVVILVLLRPVTAGAISIGRFVALVNAVLSLSGRLSWGLSSQIDTMVGGLAYLKDVYAFLSFEETRGATDVSIPQRDVRSIVFQNVSFAYPGSTHRVLDKLSFTLKGGRHYAFVGANGAGKTTVIKLLTGLYSNYDGEILINERELRTYSAGELKGFFSAVYQDFARHQLTIRENILLGNLDLLQSGDEAGLLESLRLTELTEAVDRLPNGLDTALGKIHPEGADLSGGQWQRLAMARAIVSPAPVRILDEPTAAQDPISENKLYALFEKVSHSVTTVLISHRLASTKLADEILVFENGAIAEKGDYASLMAQKGLYFRMFEQQRSWYQ